MPSIAPSIAHGTPKAMKPSRKIVYFHSLYLRGSANTVPRQHTTVGQRIVKIQTCGWIAPSTDSDAPVRAHDGARDDAEETRRHGQPARHLDVEERGEVEVEDVARLVALVSAAAAAAGRGRRRALAPR